MVSLAGVRAKLQACPFVETQMKCAGLKVVVQQWCLPVMQFSDISDRVSSQRSLVNTLTSVHWQQGWQSLGFPHCLLWQHHGASYHSWRRMLLGLQEVANCQHLPEGTWQGRCECASSMSTCLLQWLLSETAAVTRSPGLCSWQHSEPLPGLWKHSCYLTAPLLAGMKLVRWLGSECSSRIPATMLRGSPSAHVSWSLCFLP